MTLVLCMYRVSHKSGTINNTVRLLCVTVVSDGTG